MKFIKLTSAYGTTTYCNPKHITAIRAEREITNIWFYDDEPIKVKDTPEEILKLIGNLRPPT